MWENVESICHRTSSGLLTHFVSCQRPGLIYRGVGCEDWTLSPSIARAICTRRIDAVYGDDARTFKELSYLAHFINACDDAGLRVVGDSSGLRDFFLEPKGENGRGQLVDLFRYPSLWPGDDDVIFHFLAQAQHHGVPTRLLDWTGSPLVACYFAVSQAIHERVRMRSRCDEANLLDWNISIVELDTTKTSGYKEIFRIRKAPGATSQNLAAQKGIFTFIKGFDLDGLDLLSHSSSAVFLKRHLLPLSEAYGLIQSIARLGVTTATLFPGYEGAAKHSTETILLDDLAQEIRDLSG